MNSESNLYGLIAKNSFKIYDEQKETSDVDIYYEGKFRYYIRSSTKY